MIKTVRELSKLWNCEQQLIQGIETNKLIQSALPLTISETIYNMPVIKANDFKSAAGKAVFKHPDKSPHIKLHPALYDDNDEVVSQRLETFFHEIAHQIAYLTKRDNRHGSAWAYCLMHFGFAPERCYDSAAFNFHGYEKRNKIRGVEATVVILDDIGDFEL